jgi:hypothetical protein
MARIYAEIRSDAPDYGASVRRHAQHPTRRGDRSPARIRRRAGFHPFARDGPDQLDLYLSSAIDATLRQIR